MLWLKLQSCDLNKCFDLDSTLVVYLDQSMDASSDSRHGSRLRSDTGWLVCLLGAELVQRAHALFGTGVKSPGMRFDFMCLACFVMQLSCS